jgi:hypothetical protein
LKSHKSSSLFYEIRVEGELGDMWANWFEGLSIREEFDGANDRHITVLFGLIQDQPALHGVLNKIRDLNLTLISIKKHEPK